jgi:hypothetical protein
MHQRECPRHALMTSYQTRELTDLTCGEIAEVCKSGETLEKGACAVRLSQIADQY